MLLVNVHELDIILAQAVALAGFEHQVYHIRRILRLQRQDIFVLCTSEDLHQGAQIDSKSNVAVAAKRGEGLGFEHHRDERDMGIVHGL